MASGSQVPVRIRTRALPWALPLALLGALAACQSPGGSSSGSSGPPPTPPVAGTKSEAGCTGTVDPIAVNDPLYKAQWHINTAATLYFNDSTAQPSSGSDITQQKSTESGCGVKVAVVDTGLEIAHEDLAPNVVPGASSNFNTGGNDPTNPATTGDHGTSVAGLVGARANNGKGGRGVAGEASLVGYNFISSSQSLAYYYAALGGVAYSADVDVFNESFGADASIDPTVEAQYLYGVTTLRGGEGAIYVKAAGNGFGSASGTPSNPFGFNCGLANAAGVSCEDANMDGENSIPYTIVVGALNAGYPAGTGPSPQQTKSSYSTAGSALWISAPGGEFGASNLVVQCGPPSSPVNCTHPQIDAAMITTDQSGCNAGYAVTTFNGTTTINDFNLGGTGTQLAYNPNCDYTSTFNGTSSATPVTSGAIAVVLQANPNLTWRDVKYILAATAYNDKTSPALDSKASTTVTCTNAAAGPQSFVAAAWTTHTINSAQVIDFHPWYGFGKINLDAAVAMAAPGSWTPNGFGTSKAAPAAWTDTGYLPTPTTLAPGGTIPSCSTTGIQTATLSVTPTVAFIEAVQVNVCVRHPNIGELQVELINLAPSTPEHAVILPGQNGFNGVNTSSLTYPNDCQLFLVNQFYGESAASGFQLAVYDTGAGPSTAGNSGTLDGWQIRVWGH